MTPAYANPYLREVFMSLPRLLAGFDRDPLSPTRGLGDRRYWAWKTQDFPNATPQSAVHGLARLLAADLLPQGMSRSSVLERIDSVILATRMITARDGSLGEAFPTEKSFCVTALVAFDILVAADLLAPELDPSRLRDWRDVAAPLVDFLCRNGETHAIISNHLATGVAALMRWDGAGSATAHARARELLDVILDNQSDEGWFSEYEGADPGYETLGLTYLADVHLQHPELGLEKPLGRSLEFLQNFAHPDGSFGGGYGSRNTRFLVPGGVEALADGFPVAAALAAFARRSISDQRVVTLAAIDEPNLAPHFNAYCWAATKAAASLVSDVAELPFERAERSRRELPHAGLVIDSTPRRYTVISVAKGGYIASFDKAEGRARIDAGVIARSGNHLWSTQAHRNDNRWSLDGDRLIVVAPFVAVITERPTPFQFVILRLLALTLFHWRLFTEWVKRRLVERLITGQRRLPVDNRREIFLGDELEVVDIQSPPGVVSVEQVGRPFSAIHMASSGYWQAQDDQS
ncbi:hypothetical protein [Bosea sp. (in: a-proteobacteria)]